MLDNSGCNPGRAVAFLFVHTPLTPIRYISDHLLSAIQFHDDHPVNGLHIGVGRRLKPVVDKFQHFFSAHGHSFL